MIIRSSRKKKNPGNHTQTNEFSPVPMAKFVVHRITPVPWSLVLRCASPLKAEPRPLRALHVTTANTWLIVQGEAGATSFLVRSQVKLGDDARNDLVVEVFRILEGKGFEALPKVEAPLARDVVRNNLLRLRIVGSTLHDHVVCVGIPGAGSQKRKWTKPRPLLTVRPFGGGPPLLGV